LFIENGILKHIVIVSDDAGQFDMLLHALYWIHTGRAIDKIIVFSDQAQNDLATVKNQIRMIPLRTGHFAGQVTGSACGSFDLVIRPKRS
jgi:hypothetical protein